MDHLEFLRLLRDYHPKAASERHKLFKDCTSDCTSH